MHDVFNKFGTAIDMFRWILGWAAASADDPASSTFNAQHGNLNYRTGSLDDGTDPYGWYEAD